LRTAWAAQPKPPKPQDAFEMSKQHLDGLAVAARRFVGKDLSGGWHHQRSA
jgi:hypothetical protein